MSFWSKIFKSNATESKSAADKETNETSSQLTDDEKQQIKSQIKDLTEQLNDNDSERSEERRVGKECRTRRER